MRRRGCGGVEGDVRRRREGEMKGERRWGGKRRREGRRGKTAWRGDAGERKEDKGGRHEEGAENGGKRERRTAGKHEAARETGEGRGNGAKSRGLTVLSGKTGGGALRPALWSTKPGRRAGGGACAQAGRGEHERERERACSEDERQKFPDGKRDFPRRSACRVSPEMWTRCAGTSMVAVNNL